MRFFLYILISVLLAGCTTGAATRVTSISYTPTEASSLQVFFEKPSRPYTVIGFVSAQGDAYVKEAAVFKKLKEEAAKIGADALLMRHDVTEEQDASGYQMKRGTGLALKWVDPPSNLQNR